MKSRATAIVIALFLALAATTASRTATVLHQYGLGEAGTLNGSGLALDSVGTAHFNDAGSTTDFVAAAHVGTPVPGSTHYSISDGAGNGQFMTAVVANQWSTLDSQNHFIIELYARVANSSGIQTMVQSDNIGGAIQFTHSAGSWILFYNSVSGIASTPLTLNEWTHLAAVVSTTAGTATTSFYVDGNLMGSANIARASLNTGRAILAATQGGSQDFVGDLDGLRVQTYNPATENPVDLFNLVVIPVPAAMPAGLAMLAAIALHRRTRS